VVDRNSGRRWGRRHAGSRAHAGHARGLALGVPAYRALRNPTATSWIALSPEARQRVGGHGTTPTRGGRTACTRIA